MPARMIDGDAVAGSDKLVRCSLSAKAWYSYFLTLALANGSFEVSFKSIWAKYFSKLAPEFTPDQIEIVFGEYEREKLLFRWTGGDSKQWGYWTAIERRLPKPSDIKRKRMKRGDDVSARDLARFLGRPYKAMLKELSERIGKPHSDELAEIERGHRGAAGGGRPPRGDNIAQPGDRIARGLGLGLEGKRGGVRSRRRTRPPSPPSSSSPSSSLATLAPPPAPPRLAGTAEDKSKKKKIEVLAGETPMRFNDAPKLDKLNRGTE